MKLWNIKAEALRIMFADTDIQFSIDEFSGEKEIYNNANTREKLVLMEASIRRAIDQYYKFAGQPTVVVEVGLDVDTEVYSNSIDFSGNALFDIPKRIDAKFYDSDDEDVQTFRMTSTEIDFVYDEINKKVMFLHDEYTDWGADVKFIVWYKRAKVNIPYTTIDELTYELDTLYIPEEVQRMIPYFIKGELYEEDEEGSANNAMQTYIYFLRGLDKRTVKRQTKVKRSAVFGKTN